ncbi:MAG: fumarylacetoacetate hydrolase family protein [Pseudomonadota bacterium]
MTREKANRALVDALRKRGLSAIAKASKLLVAAHRSRTPGAAGELALGSDEEAYRVQDNVFAELWPGARPAGWKVGGPSDKVTPTAAPVPPERVLRSPASVQRSALNMVGVEAEVAFRLARDLPLRSRPYSERSIAAAVGEVLVAIELCGSRLANWKETPGLWKLADFQSNSALVVGSGTKEWQKVDFAAQECEFTVGDRVVRAKGAHPFGNPFRLLPWLVKHAAKRGHGLRAGDIVTTGAWTGLVEAEAGDTVTARFAGIGEAGVKIL